MDVELLDQLLLVGALVLVAAIVAVQLITQTGVPILLVFLALGVGLGEAGVGIEFEDAELAHALGFAALVVILAEGGLTTRWQDVRRSMPIGAVLATAGVAVSTAVIAVVAHHLLGFSWTASVLIGAVFAPTDAAAVFSVLRRVPLRRRLSGTLETESGLNDAPTVVLITLLSTGEAAELGPVGIAAVVLYELVAGGVVGYAVGRTGAWALRRVALPGSGLYPLAVMTVAVLAYGMAASALHASGFAAVYVASLVLGNSELPHRTANRSFAEGLAWLAQIGLFVMLGMLSSPSRFIDVLAPALLLGSVLILVARPLSVVVSVAPFRTSLREMAFLSWAGLRGAVPIVLATIPRSYDVPAATTIFDIVFVVSALSTLIQGPPLPWLARVLRVAESGGARDLEVEAAPLERVSADLLQVRVTHRSHLHGVAVRELRLPSGASVVLVLRGADSMVPAPQTVLRHGDELLVVTPRRHREATERRLQAVSRSGRLAGWFGEGGGRPA